MKMKEKVTKFVKDNKRKIVTGVVAVGSAAIGGAVVYLVMKNETIKITTGGMKEFLLDVYQKRVNDTDDLYEIDYISGKHIPYGGKEVMTIGDVAEWITEFSKDIAERKNVEVDNIKTYLVDGIYIIGKRDKKN